MKQNEENYQALELLVNQITKDDLILLTLLFSKDNKKLSYNILYILVNISYANNKEKIFSLDEDICCYIASFLGNNKDDSTFLKYGILLIRNISFDKNVCEIFNKYKIIHFFGEIYEKNLLNNKFMEHIMIIIGNIINYEIEKNDKYKDISYLLPCIKIISTQLRPNYPASLLNKYIYHLYNLISFGNSDIFYEIINCKIHRDLMNLYSLISEKLNSLKQDLNPDSKIFILKTPEQISKDYKDIEFYKNIHLLILKILGGLMSTDDGILTQTLLNANISLFLKNLLKSDDIRVIKNVCFCISNICAGTCGQISYLLKDNTFYELILVSKNIFEAFELREIKDDYYRLLQDTLREIIYAFSLAISNSIFEKIMTSLKSCDFIIIKILVKGLIIFQEKKYEDILEIIFEVIRKIYLFDNNKSNFIDIMEKYGLKENLENLIQNGSKSARIISDALYNSIFKFDKMDDRI